VNLREEGHRKDHAQRPGMKNPKEKSGEGEDANLFWEGSKPELVVCDQCSVEGGMKKNLTERKRESSYIVCTSQPVEPGKGGREPVTSREDRTGFREKAEWPQDS